MKEMTLIDSNNSKKKTNHYLFLHLFGGLAFILFCIRQEANPKWYLTRSRFTLRQQVQHSHP